MMFSTVGTPATAAAVVVPLSSCCNAVRCLLTLLLALLPPVNTAVASVAECAATVTATATLLALDAAAEVAAAVYAKHWPVSERARNVSWYPYA